VWKETPLTRVPYEKNMAAALVPYPSLPKVSPSNVLCPPLILKGTNVNRMLVKAK
jgi:hypothetical protein